MSVRRFWLTLAVVALTALPASAAPCTGQAGEQRGLTVPAWFTAVDKHAPGMKDASTAAAATWSKAELDRLLPALRGCLNLKAYEDLRNDVLRRGALLHMDTAILLSREPAQQVAPPSTREPSSPRRTSMAGLSVRGTDGEYQGLQRTGLHWDFGRTLLDALDAGPSTDETARRWYRAAAAYMANTSEFAELVRHLRRAEELFPEDPEILYVSGCLYEAFNSPRVREISDSPALPPGVQVHVPSKRHSWERAESYFARAVAIRPDFADAHVRHGRVLHMLGRHDAARQALREAEARTELPAVLYLAALFEGGLLESMSDAAGARAAYERAAVLFPNAQSPSVALSHLARERGDPAGALAAAQRMFARRARDDGDDPWWAYHLVHVRHADALFVELRAPFPGKDVR